MIGSNGAKFVTANISDYVRSLFYCCFTSSSTDKVSIIGVEMELNLYLWQKLLMFTCAIPVLAPKHLTSFMEGGDVASLRGDFQRKMCRNTYYPVHSITSCGRVWWKVPALEA